MNDAQRDTLLLEIRDQLAENTRKTEKILEGFPGGDTDGHKRYHQAIIDRMELRNKIVRGLVERAAQAGFFGAIALIGSALYHHFLAGGFTK